MRQIAELMGTSLATCKRRVAQKEKEIGHTLTVDDIRNLIYEFEEQRREKELETLLFKHPRT